VKSFNYWETLHRVEKLLCGQRCTRGWFCSCDTAERCDFSCGLSLSDAQTLRGSQISHLSPVFLVVVDSCVLSHSLRCFLSFFCSLSLSRHLFILLSLSESISHPATQAHSFSSLASSRTVSPRLTSFPITILSLSLLIPPSSLSLSLLSLSLAASAVAVPVGTKADKELSSS
jgi:hypothetical protein